MIRQLRKWEPLLLFLAVFFPGYISQAAERVSPSLFNSPGFNLLYLSLAGSQLVLIIYLILLDPKIPHPSYGLRPFRRTIPLKALGGVGLIALILLPVYQVNALLISQGLIPQSEIIPWEFSNYPLLPLVFLTCLTTGYLEEGYFRSYLLTKGEQGGIGRPTLVISTNILFALGHLYQGIWGFLVTFLIGLVLSWLFLKKRNLHLIAWSHGYYNFLVLALAALTTLGEGQGTR